VCVVDFVGLVKVFEIMKSSLLLSILSVISFFSCHDV